MARLHKALAAGRPVFGMNVYSGSPAAVEIAGAWSLDFVFIDAEHSVLGLDLPMERMLLAARLAGIAPLVRVPDSGPTGLRKALELGATGVIVPQVHDAAQMRAIVEAAKFPPLGRRGGDSSVRSAGWAGPGFDWVEYAARSNRETLVIPMAESREFFDDIDAILAVPGIDAVHFGPADFALSNGLPVDYSMHEPVIREAMQLLVAKCREKGIHVMLPCAPTTPEHAAELFAAGGDMLLVGNDIGFLNQGCRVASGIATALKGDRR